VFLLTYPFAIFFSVPYTESLYLLGAIAAFYHLRRDECLASGGWALLVGLSRPNGCMLAIPLAIAALRTRNANSPFARWAVVAMPVVGMLSYSLYAYSLTGHPFVWAELQRSAWGRTFQGVGHAFVDVSSALTQFLMLRSPAARVSEAVNGVGALFALVTIWPVTRRLGAAYGAFVAIGVLLPLVNGGVDSMGRYSAVLFPSFVWLGLVVPPRQRALVASALAMGQAVVAMLFFTWRPIF
jgi:hypothetical protein